MNGLSTSAGIYWRRAVPLLPGFALCALVAVIGQGVATLYGGPALLMSLLLGFAVIPHGERYLESGVVLCAGPVLKLGVAMLGVRISMAEVQSLWAMPLTVVLVTVPLILALAWLLGKVLKLPAAESLVAGASVAICGVTAAMAVAAALPRGQLDARRLVAIAVCVPALGSLALLLYPHLAEALGFADVQVGILLGATIHDVGQATASGYLISEQAGQFSTVTKLMRVSLLMPLVLLVGFIFRRSATERSEFPLFLLGFVLLLAANNLGLIPDVLRDFLEQASGWCLLLTMAALGARTSFKQLLVQDWRPVALLVGLSVILLLVAAFLVALLPVFQTISFNTGG